MKEYKLKYGKGEQSVMLDESKVLQIIDAAPGEKITDLKKAVLDAVRNPVGSAPLREVVKQGDKVVILVSDITRAWTRTSEYLPIVVEELNNSGIPDADISVIVAAGTHRPIQMKKRKLCMIFLLCLALMTLVAGCRSKKETNDQGNQKRNSNLLYK